MFQRSRRLAGLENIYIISYFFSNQEWRFSHNPNLLSLSLSLSLSLNDGWSHVVISGRKMGRTDGSDLLETRNLPEGRRRWPVVHTYILRIFTIIIIIIIITRLWRSAAEATKSRRDRFVLRN